MRFILLEVYRLIRTNVKKGQVKLGLLKSVRLNYCQEALLCIYWQALSRRSGVSVIV